MKKSAKSKPEAAESEVRVVVYARTSVGKERVEDGDRSIPDQVADCEAYAKVKGWTVVEVFREANRSSWVYPSGADDIARLDAAYQRELRAHPGVKPKREKLGALLAAMRDGEVDVVLVRDQTRLSRPLADGLMGNWLKGEFVTHGIRLVSVQEGEIDFHDFGSALASDVVGRVLSEERKRRLKNSMRKIAENRDAGKVWRKMSRYGLTSNHNGGLVVDEPRARIVREVFDRICEDESYWHITCDLARRDDAPPPIGGGKWGVWHLGIMGKKRPLTTHFRPLSADFKSIEIVFKGNDELRQQQIAIEPRFRQSRVGRVSRKGFELCALFQRFQ